MNAQPASVRPFGWLVFAILLCMPPQSRSATFVVTNSADSGAGTLRQAILNANTNINADTITFSLAAPYRVQPITGLPAITNTVTLDASGAVTNRLDGLVAGAASGLSIYNTTNCAIKGLHVLNFGNGGISINRARDIRVESCVVFSNNTGIYIDQSDRCVIGGTNVAGRNVISGNGGPGISIGGLCSNIYVQGNFIGSDPAGTQPWPNATGIGVRGGPGNRIGGTNAAYGTLWPGNLISGNDGAGIELNQQGTGTVVQGNFIGVDAAGQNSLSNQAGIAVYSPSNRIGGALAGVRNVISANRMQGLFLSGTQVVGNLVYGNYIGTDLTGSNALGNIYGIEVYNARGNFIGGAGAGEGNLVSGNRSIGIYISGFSGNYEATGNVVRANYVGVDASGARALPNAEAGVRIHCPYNQVGDALAGNLLSGNGGYGLYLYDQAHHTTVLGNLVGTDLSGSFAVSNAAVGVRMEGAHHSIVGTEASGAGNVISGNGTSGLYLFGTNTYGVSIAGNRIGVGAAGTSVIANGHSGVFCYDAWSNDIGKAVAGGGNIISGNREAGVSLQNSHFNKIRNNYIGTDAGGTLSFGNHDGVYLVNSADNWIGTSSASGGNIIGGSLGAGVYLMGTGCVLNTIDNNQIGMGASGGPCGNLTGVHISGGVSNLVGGGSDANIVAYNLGAGVRVNGSATGVAIIGNDIFANDGLGIALGDDVVTANDPADADSGPNGLQNFPVITSVSTNGGKLVISGTLNSTPLHNFWIEYFGDVDCDVSGHGEGLLFLGRSINVNSDAGGNATFSITNLPLADPPPSFISATATDSNLWNTSEFSKWVMLDSDNDGMPDGFERAFFGSATNGSPNGQNDGDGFRNLDEFIANTDPTNSASYPRIVSTLRTNGAIAVKVESSAYRQYALQISMPGDANNWQAPGTFQDGMPLYTTLTDATPLSTSVLHRIRVRLPVAGD